MIPLDMMPAVPFTVVMEPAPAVPNCCPGRAYYVMHGHRIHCGAAARPDGYGGRDEGGTRGSMPFPVEPSHAAIVGVSGAIGGAGGGSFAERPVTPLPPSIPPPTAAVPSPVAGTGLAGVLAALIACWLCLKGPRRDAL